LLKQEVELAKHEEKLAKHEEKLAKKGATKKHCPIAPPFNNKRIILI